MIGIQAFTIGRRYIPTALALLGLAVMAYPFFTNSIYQNIIIAVGFLSMFMAWVEANLQKGILNKKFAATPEWQQQKKIMIGMSLCVALGFGMLTYYELQMPKYEVPKVSKTLYTLPPHLSKSELKEMGKDCNTYGNTLCSHDVFAEIVRRDPRDYKALANLAMAQSHLGFHEYALMNFARAIKNGIQTYDTYRFMGHSFMASNQKNKALDAYQKSLKMNPNQEWLQNRVQELSR